MKRDKVFKIGLVLFLINFVIGVYFLNKVPDVMPIHFDGNDVADKYADKYFALFGIPIFMLILYVVAYFFTNKDPRRKFQGDMALNVVLMIAPILSIATTFLSVYYSLGKTVKIGFWINIFLSIMFVLVGNYLPKTKRNYTIGIKVPWTLDNDYVWEKTHRFGGYVYVIGGILLFLGNMFFYNYIENIAIIVVVIIAFAPMVYSYIIYKNISGNN
ncbi:putative membrane protein [Peptoniphilus sp. ING2-D1G]|nr:putative membrane protein [Peptoniphilus sp. ING2-D1G]